MKIIIIIIKKQEKNKNKGFPGGAVVKNQPASAGDAKNMGSILGLGRSHGVGNGNHSTILAWIIPCSVELGRLQSMRLKASDKTEHAH